MCRGLPPTPSCSWRDWRSWRVGRVCVNCVYMVSENPFSHCLFPKRILNKYTHEWILVPCGHCEACALTRNSRLKLQTSLEVAAHRFSVFITLTFDESSVPRLVTSYAVDDYGFPIIQFFDSVDGQLVLEVPRTFKQEEELDKIKLKVENDFIPYLRKDILQRFVKRLRKYLDEKTSDKIRYIAVGEYGPVHLRPHFHLLCTTDSIKVAKEMGKAVFACWPFGRCRTELPKKDPTQYLTGYINSFSSLPEVFKERALCPFSLHSQFLGQKLLFGERTEVYKTSFKDFISRSLPISSHLAEFNLWRQAYAIYFPKCKGFDDKTSLERDYAYRLLLQARKFYSECQTTLAIARRIAEDIVLFHGCTTVQNDKHRKLLNYLYDSDYVNDNLNDEQYEKYVNSIYTQLLVSKRFLTFVCDHQTIKEMTYKRSLIENFYKNLDYYHLTEWYESQVSYLEQDTSDNDDIIFFYDNTWFDFEAYKRLPVARRFYASCKREYIERNKHKKLNDLNRLLFNN